MKRLPVHKKVTFSVAKRLHFVATFYFSNEWRITTKYYMNIPNNLIRTNKKRLDGSGRFRRSPKTIAAIYTLRNTITQFVIICLIIILIREK